MTECTMEMLEERLQGLVLYDKQGIKLELTADEAIEEFEDVFKCTRTIKYDAFDYFKALRRAVVYVASCYYEDSVNILYDYVIYRCPKLTHEQMEALKVIETQWKLDGFLSKMYHSPITQKDMTQIKLYADDCLTILKGKDRALIQEAVDKLF